MTTSRWQYDLQHHRFYLLLKQEGVPVATAVTIEPDIYKDKLPVLYTYEQTVKYQTTYYCLPVPQIPKLVRTFVQYTYQRVPALTRTKQRSLLLHKSVSIGLLAYMLRNIAGRISYLSTVWSIDHTTIMYHRSKITPFIDLYRQDVQQDTKVEAGLRKSSEYRLLLEYIRILSLLTYQHCSQIPIDSNQYIQLGAAESNLRKLLQTFNIKDPNSLPPIIKQSKQLIQSLQKQIKLLEEYYR